MNSPSWCGLISRSMKFEFFCHFAAPRWHMTFKSSNLKNNGQFIMHIYYNGWRRKGHGKSKHHDDVIKWKHFSRNWPFVWGIHRSRWIPHTKASDAELWCFLWSLICVWIHGWVNNREAGDLRRHRCYYNVNVMIISTSSSRNIPGTTPEGLTCSVLNWIKLIQWVIIMDHNITT